MVVVVVVVVGSVVVVVVVVVVVAGSSSSSSSWPVVVEGVTSAEALEEKWKSLVAHAAPWQATSARAKVFPHMVFVHMCEVAQVLADSKLGKEAVEIVLACPAAAYEEAVSATLKGLLCEEDAPGRSECHLQLVLGAALKAAQELGNRGRAERVRSGQTRGHGGQTPPLRRQGIKHTIRLHLKTHGKKAGHKSHVVCDVCNRKVRKDVLSRHKQTARCQRA